MAEIHEAVALVDEIGVLVGAFLFILIWYGPWQSLCVDWARQRMIEARDLLFRAAIEDLISFESSEYRQLRASIDRMIRFAPQLTWYKTVAYLTILRDEWDGVDAFEVISRIQNVEGRAAAESAAQKVARAVLLCVMCRSVMLAPAFVIFWYVSTLNSAPATKVYDFVQREADAVGSMPKHNRVARAA